MISGAGKSLGNAKQSEEGSSRLFTDLELPVASIPNFPEKEEIGNASPSVLNPAD
jgi:hypothetical protein